MHYRLNTIVFLEFGHCKSSSCQEQKMVGMLGLHEALPKWQFESIIVFSSKWPAAVRVMLYSYFEKGCQKKCTRQSRKVLWVVLSSLFFKEI